MAWSTYKRYAKVREGAVIHTMSTEFSMRLYVELIANGECHCAISNFS